MSFRKRGEVIGNGGSPRIPVRGPPINSPVPLRGIAPSPVRGTPIPQRQIPAPNGSPVVVKNEIQHPGIRPSTVTSQPTISTGSSDLDKILLHSGLPVGCSLLVEETGTTDFSSVILRVFAAQGIRHNRIDNDNKNLNTHVIVVGHNVEWTKELPGLYKGSSKDIKKAKILENESKISVSNLTDATSNARDLKIAWRYGLNDKKQESNSTDIGAETYPHYNNQFDITSRLVPAPNGQEITCIPIASLTFQPILKQIETTIKSQLRQNNSKIIRIVVPSLLNPSIYPPTLSAINEIIPFYHGLRSLLRQYNNNVTAITSLALDLYPSANPVTSILETLHDGIIQLQPFNQEMTAFIEKAYKNEPTKIQHGLVNVLKVPVLSDRGSMMIRIGEFAFKNGKKRFEIEEWGIPVEDEEEEKQTTKNVDF